MVEEKQDQHLFDPSNDMYKVDDKRLQENTDAVKVPYGICNKDWNRALLHMVG